MKSIRIKIALLVMGAIIAMSLLGIAGSYSFYIFEADNNHIVFRYHTNTSAPQGTLVEELHDHGLAHYLPAKGIAILFGTLIVAGAGIVGLIVANMVVRPLFILQHAIDSVNPHNLIPPIAEAKPIADLGATKLLNTLALKIRTTMESRMRLVASAGHDLRTPITRMMLRLEFMPKSDERDHWEKDILEMAHIAESAIKLVKEEIGLESRESIYLEMMLLDLQAELSDLDYKISLNEVTPCMIKGGFHSIKRALSNLILNAAIHGNSAEITMSETSTHAVITISDNGPGIPEELISIAFEPFFRVNPSKSRTSDGAGLGLSIAKEIIERHGGCIVLHNRTGGGLIQTIQLPLDT